MEVFPEVRLSLDRMRQSMVTAFVDYNGRMEATVKEQLDHIVETFDFKAEIESMAAGVFRDHIRQAMVNAVSSLKWDESIRKSLVQHILKQIANEKDWDELDNEFFIYKQKSNQEIRDLKKEIESLKRKLAEQNPNG